MDKVVVQLTVNDPAMDTPAMRAWLNEVAELMTNDEAFQATCQHAQDELLAFGSTTLAREDDHA